MRVPAMSFLCCRAPRSRTPDELTAQPLEIFLSNEKRDHEVQSTLPSESLNPETMNDAEEFNHIFEVSNSCSSLPSVPGGSKHRQYSDDRTSSGSFKGGHGLRKRISKKLSKASKLSRRSPSLRLPKNTGEKTRRRKKEFQQTLDQNHGQNFDSEEEDPYDTDAKSLFVPPSAGSTWLRESMQPLDCGSEDKIPESLMQVQVQEDRKELRNRGFPNSRPDSGIEDRATQGFDSSKNHQTLIKDINRTLADFDFDETRHSQNESLHSSIDVRSLKDITASNANCSLSINPGYVGPSEGLPSDTFSTNKIPDPPMLKPLRLPSFIPSRTASLWRLSRSYADTRRSSFIPNETQADGVCGDSMARQSFTYRKMFRAFDDRKSAPSRQGNGLTLPVPVEPGAGKIDCGYVEDVFTDNLRPHRKASGQFTANSSEDTGLGGVPRLYEMRITEILAPSELQSTLSLPLRIGSASSIRRRSGSSVPSTLPRTRQYHQQSASFSSSIVPKWWGTALKIDPIPSQKSQEDGYGTGNDVTIPKTSLEDTEQQRQDTFDYLGTHPPRRRATFNSNTDSSILWASETSSFRARELTVASKKSVRTSHPINTPKRSRFREQFSNESEDILAPEKVPNSKPQVAFRSSNSHDGSEDWGIESEKDSNISNYTNTPIDPTPEIWGKAIRSHRESLEAQTSWKTPTKPVYRSMSEGGRIFRNRQEKSTQAGHAGHSRSKTMLQLPADVETQGSGQLKIDQDGLSSSSNLSQNSTKPQNVQTRSKLRLSLRRKALQTPLTSNVKSSWSRFPSHTQHIRSASAGEGDNVTVRDFANQTVAERRRHQPLRENGKKSQSMTLGRRVRHGWNRLVRSGSTEFRISGYGPRSSIAAGGPSEYPELQILSPVFLHTSKTRKRGSVNGSGNVFQADQTDSSNSEESLMAASKWSELYHDCVEFPADRSSPESEGPTKEAPIRPKIRRFQDPSESSSRLHQSTIDLKKVLEGNEARERAIAIELVEKAWRENG